VVNTTVEPSMPLSSEHLFGYGKAFAHVNMLDPCWTKLIREGASEQGNYEMT
jgi:hypothetical protein